MTRLEEFREAHAWIREWQEGEIAYDDATLEWLRSRPSSVMKLMLRFPPSCLVAPRKPLRCPAPDTFGIVHSYLEPDDENPEGSLSVRQHPEAGFRAHCSPSDLLVVGFHRGLTPTRLIHLLSGAK